MYLIRNKKILYISPQSYYSKSYFKPTGNMSQQKPHLWRLAKAIFFLLVFFSSSQLLAQNYASYNWYFGSSAAGLSFNKSDAQAAQVNDQNAAMGIGGGAVATDHRTGQLLFYTDGTTVYDARHQAMPNGTGLIANNSRNQAAVVVPRPGSPDEYFVFTNDANFPAGGTLRYSVVDMAAQGNAPATQPPLGVVQPASKNTATGITNIAEGMMVIESGNDPYRYWLIAQDVSTNEVLLFEVTAAGPVLRDALLLPVDLDAASFAYHEASGRIAIAPQNPNVNAQLITFDPAAGTLSYDQPILNSAFNDAAAQQAYDIAFSPDGTKIFISRFGDNSGQDGVLYRYDLTATNPSLDVVNTPALYRSYGLQMGPDGNLYHLYQETNGGPFLIGRVANPNEQDIGLLSYEATPFGNTNFNARQFPSFSPRRDVDLGAAPFLTIGNCLGNPTKFVPQLDEPADSYLWDFGDLANPDPPANQRNPFPVYEYGQPGTYNVRLIVRANGSVDTLTQQVTITQQDTVDLGQDTVICPGETLTLDAGSGFNTYVWNTGETGQQITVDSTGYYWVVASSGGCSSYDGINVEVYGEQTQVANVWYFGDEAGIDFNDQPPTPLTDGQIQSPAGAAAISDRNGDLLFYTDGNAVFDRDHNLMFNGNAIGGDNTASQSSIIVPFPDDETLFYIFTTRDVFDAGGDHSYELSYSIVDIKETGNGSVGEVIAKDVPLLSRSTERIAAIQAGGGYWLMAHEMGSNTFYAYPITETGIMPPVLSSVGSAHNASTQANAEGYMKFSPDGTRLAVAFADPPDNYVELFDFDATTGELSNYIQVDLNADFPANSSYQVYGVEFASNSDKLFVTLNDPGGANGRLFEVKLHNYVEDSIQDNIDLIEETSGVNYGAIQTGPDGQLYIAMDGQGFIGQFFPNLDTATVSTFDYDNNRFDLAGRTSGLGLPNFVQNFTNQPPSPAASVTPNPGCIGQVITFSGSGTSSIDEFSWTFGDGAGASMAEAEHTYFADSTYIVTLRITNRCGLDTAITQNLVISGEPNEPTIDEVGIICQGPLVLDADSNNVAGLSFFWSTGETTKTIDVEQPGLYSVRILNSVGCQSEDTIDVYDGRPQFDLGPNMTVCEDDSIVLNTGLPVGNPANTFSWTVNGAPIGGNQRFLAINTSNPGIFDYRVNVIDGLTGCVNNDSIIVTINPTPTATYDIVNSTCGNSDGSISINSSLQDLSVEWYNAGNTLLTTGPALSNVPAGAYTLRVISNITGCSREYSIDVIDDVVPFTVDTQSLRQDCLGDTLDIALGGVASPASVEYTLVDQTNNIIYPMVSAAAAVFEVPIPGPASYSLQIRADGCLDTVLQVVNALPTANLTVDPVFDECSDDAEIEASSTSAGATYVWNGPGVSNAAGQSLPVTNAGEYAVTVSATGVCDTTATTQVNINSSPSAEIISVTDGCNGTKQLGVNAIPGGNYSHLWSTGQVGQVIQVNQSGNYGVTIQSQVTGCTAQDNADVQVFQPFVVNVTVDQQPCLNENLITLTAVPIPAQGQISYEWFLNNVELRDTTSALETFNEGLFRADLTVGGVCTSSGTLEIIRAPVTPSEIDPEYRVCPEPPANEVAEIEPGNFLFYQAFNVETGEQVFESLPGLFEIQESGEYRFLLENAFGCVTQDTTEVIVSCVPTVYVPNAFSPGASIAENKTFHIYPTYVRDFEIFIYNRWGELIFFSDDLDFMTNEGWDGRGKNGDLLPSGTYAYVMKYRSITETDTGEYQQPGGVVLLR
jgi:PKD repeat protein